jgi:hypothetical protein
VVSRAHISMYVHEKPAGASQLHLIRLASQDVRQSKTVISGKFEKCRGWYSSSV